MGCREKISVVMTTYNGETSITPQLIGGVPMLYQIKNFLKMPGTLAYAFKNGLKIGGVVS